MDIRSDSTANGMGTCTDSGYGFPPGWWDGICLRALYSRGVVSMWISPEAEYPLAFVRYHTPLMAARQSRVATVHSPRFVLNLHAEVSGSGSFSGGGGYVVEYG